MLYRLLLLFPFLELPLLATASNDSNATTETPANATTETPANATTETPANATTETPQQGGGGGNSSNNGTAVVTGAPDPAPSTSPAPSSPVTTPTPTDTETDAPVTTPTVTGTTTGTETGTSTDAPSGSGGNNTAENSGASTTPEIVSSAITISGLTVSNDIKTQAVKAVYFANLKAHIPATMAVRTKMESLISSVAAPKLCVLNTDCTIATTETTDACLYSANEPAWTDLDGVAAGTTGGPVWDCARRLYKLGDIAAAVGASSTSAGGTNSSGGRRLTTQAVSCVDTVGLRVKPSALGNSNVAAVSEGMGTIDTEDLTTASATLDGILETGGQGMATLVANLGMEAAGGGTGAAAGANAKAALTGFANAASADDLTTMDTQTTAAATAVSTGVTGSLSAETAATITTGSTSTGGSSTSGAMGLGLSMTALLLGLMMIN